MKKRTGYIVLPSSDENLKEAVASAREDNFNTPTIGYCICGVENKKGEIPFYQESCVFFKRENNRIVIYCDGMESLDIPPITQYVTDEDMVLPFVLIIRSVVAVNIKNQLEILTKSSA